MTELVRPGRSLCASLISLTLSLALPSTSLAAPGQGPTPEGPTAPEAPTAPEVAAPSEAEILSALEAGDLTRARELAVARSQADPKADTLALEAQVWLALADYERAKAALDQALALLSASEAGEASKAGDHAALEQLREEVEDRSRGAVPDEPESTQRERLDRERADRLAALQPPTPPPSEPLDEAPGRVPIVKKWYFWVTLGAIVATAGAIVGIAVSAGLEQRNGPAAARQPAPAGGLTLRF